MRRGFLCLAAIMDSATRKVLAWRLSNTMDARFCVAALEEALARYGKPEIFNTDQGSQFTSFEPLRQHSLRQSDCKRRNDRGHEQKRCDRASLPAAAKPCVDASGKP